MSAVRHDLAELEHEIQLKVEAIIDEMDSPPSVMEILDSLERAKMWIVLDWGNRRRAQDEATDPIAATVAYSLGDHPTMLGIIESLKLGYWASTMLPSYLEVLLPAEEPVN